jgi:hypothetical protein
MSLRQGLRSFSARRRRTVSCDRPACSVSLTISPASSSSVQRTQPAGGLEQAVATNSASSLPLSLRAARFLAERRFQITEHEAAFGPGRRRAANPNTAGDLLVADPGIGGQQDLRPLQLSRPMLAAAQQRTSPPRSAWLSSTRYRTFILISSRGRPDESSDESEIRPRAPHRPASFHRKARPVSGLHLRICAHVPPGPGRG